MKEVLNHPILDVGIGLPCLELKCFSLKVIGFFASDMSDQNILLLIKFIFLRETENLLRNTKTTVKIISIDFAIFSNVTKDI